VQRLYLLLLLFAEHSIVRIDTEDGQQVAGHAGSVWAERWRSVEREHGGGGVDAGRGCPAWSAGVSARFVNVQRVCNLLELTVEQKRAALAQHERMRRGRTRAAMRKARRRACRRAANRSERTRDYTKGEDMEGVFTERRKEDWGRWRSVTALHCHCLRVHGCWRCVRTLRWIACGAGGCITAGRCGGGNDVY
jgi:hypothetical protein